MEMIVHVVFICCLLDHFLILLADFLFYETIWFYQAQIKWGLCHLCFGGQMLSSAPCFPPPSSEEEDEKQRKRTELGAGAEDVKTWII